MKRLDIQLYNAKTGESLTLPLNPETTDITNTHEIRTYTILGFGEVSVSGDKKLKRINLSNVLPDDNTFFAQLATLLKSLSLKPYNLNDTIEMLTRWNQNHEIIRIILSDRLNAEFRIEVYTDQVKESVRDSGYVIDAVEYRNPAEVSTNTINPKESNIVKLKKRAINKFIPNKKVMTAGMSVYKLAKLTYGGRFNELAKLNSIANRNADLAGQVVEMLPL